jgi:hypothetical protein
MPVRYCFFQHLETTSAHDKGLAIKSMDPENNGKIYISSFKGIIHVGSILCSGEKVKSSRFREIS